MNGTAAKNIKFMFNTEYDGAGNHVAVLDAAAQFEMSDKFNIWAGRFLPPSDRANLYGPYYSQPLGGLHRRRPGRLSVRRRTGRDNGVLYWGQFDKVKVSGGVFDGASATGNNNVISAGRVQVDFWDPEAGYYLNGTYYGGKNLLAVGVAGQVQGERQRRPGTPTSCSRRRWPDGGAFTIESEYAKYRQARRLQLATTRTDDGGYVLGELSLSAGDGHDRQVRGPRQVRAGATSARA